MAADDGMVGVIIWKKQKWLFLLLSAGVEPQFRLMYQGVPASLEHSRNTFNFMGSSMFAPKTHQFAN